MGQNCSKLDNNKYRRESFSSSDNSQTESSFFLHYYNNSTITTTSLQQQQQQQQQQNIFVTANNDITQSIPNYFFEPQSTIITTASSSTTTTHTHSCKNNNNHNTVLPDGGDTIYCIMRPKQNQKRSLFRVGPRAGWRLRSNPTQVPLKKQEPNTKKKARNNDNSNQSLYSNDDTDASSTLMPQRALADTYKKIRSAVMVNLKAVEAAKRDKSVPCGVIGLKNLGNTCFLNSSLQCLSATIPLTDYFLGYDYKSEINKENVLGTKGKLVATYAALMKKLWMGKKAVLDIRDFKNQLATFAPQFSGHRQHDAQELLSFLLDGIHEDLNRVKTRPYIEDKDCDGKRDEEDAIEAWKNYLRRNKSLVVDLFQGQLRNTCTCLECKHRNIRFEPFMYLSLPLNDDSHTVNDCLDLYLDQEILKGDDQWYCSKCKKHVDATKKIDLWILPPILIIHLKRFKYDDTGKVGSKNGAPIVYPVKQWDLSDQVRSRGGLEPTYDLFAVSNHMGVLGRGHYTAVSLNRFNDIWYEYDDSKYRSVEPSIHRDEKNTKAAYVLFYNRSEGDSNQPLNERSPLIRQQSVTRPEHWPHRQGFIDRDKVRAYRRPSLSTSSTTSSIPRLPRRRTHNMGDRRMSPLLRSAAYLKRQSAPNVVMATNSSSKSSSNAAATTNTPATSTSTEVRRRPQTTTDDAAVTNTNHTMNRSGSNRMMNNNNLSSLEKSPRISSGKNGVIDNSSGQNNTSSRSAPTHLSLKKMASTGTTGIGRKTKRRNSDGAAATAETTTIATPMKRDVSPWRTPIKTRYDSKTSRPTSPSRRGDPNDRATSPSSRATSPSRRGDPSDRAISPSLRSDANDRATSPSRRSDPNDRATSPNRRSRPSSGRGTTSPRGRPAPLRVENILDSSSQQQSKQQQRRTRTPVRRTGSRSRSERGAGGQQRARPSRSKSRTKKARSKSEPPPSNDGKRSNASETKERRRRSRTPTKRSSGRQQGTQNLPYKSRSQTSKDSHGSGSTSTGSQRHGKRITRNGSNKGMNGSSSSSRRAASLTRTSTKKAIDGGRSSSRRRASSLGRTSSKANTAKAESSSSNNTGVMIESFSSSASGRPKSTRVSSKKSVTTASSPRTKKKATGNINKTSNSTNKDGRLADIKLRF